MKRVKDIIALRLVAVAALASLAVCAGADDMAVVRSALRDGLWETARHHAKDAASAGNTEARLAILESFASEDRWDDVKATLAGWADSKDSRFDYYRAVVEIGRASCRERV